MSLREAMRFKRTKPNKYNKIRMIEGTTSKLPGEIKSGLKKGMALGGKAANAFGKVQDWGTKHFQGTALDMNTDLDMGMPNINDSMSNHLDVEMPSFNNAIDDHLGLDGGSRRHHKSSHKKKKKK